MRDAREFLRQLAAEGKRRAEEEICRLEREAQGIVPGKNDWFKIGAPEPDGITPRQRHYLRSVQKQVMDVLTPEERFSVELMEFGEWLGTLGKWEASRIISIIKGTDIAREVKRRTEASPPKKWFHTGLSKSIERGKHDEEETD